MAQDAIAGGRIVVANRASANLSVIDVRTDSVAATVPMPTWPGDNTPEPMYVVNVPAGRRVYVGDRANNRVVAFDARSFQVADVIPAGEGVFHMAADDRNRRLWVLNDVDKTVTVVDLKSHDVIATISMPVDLVAAGGIPHDFIVHPRGGAAYVTFNGLPGPDVVVKIDASTFAETARAEVGESPHIALSKQERMVLAACQNSNEVVRLSAQNLSDLGSIPVPGAHGTAVSRNGRVFYTTNLPGGGVSGLIAIDTRKGNVLSTTDTPVPVPHNVALTSNGKIYVTHSGATSTKVSVYRERVKAAPTLVATVDAGLNPFGLEFVP